MFRGFVLFLTCMVQLPIVLHAEKKVALVIGNSAYKHTATLPNPRNDAIGVARELRKLGFVIVPGGLDLNKAALDRTIQSFSEALSGADVALLFYAGHGMQVDGENYLIPLDAKLKTATSLASEAVSLNLILRLMQSKVPTSVVFLDACRDNPLSSTFSRVAAARSLIVGTGLAPMEAGSGTIISFSTEPGTVASDGEGENSPYSIALIRELINPVGDLSTILVNVRNSVMLETQNKQIPWEHSALRSTFYFHDTSNLTDAQALSLCVRLRRNPGAKEIARRVTKTLQSKRYQYGWVGGAANGGETGTRSFEVKSAKEQGGEIHLTYDWQHGKLTVVPVVMAGGSMARPSEKKGYGNIGSILEGFWRQDNGIGCVVLVMGDEEARGAWSDRIGKSPDQDSFLKPLWP